MSINSENNGYYKVWSIHLNLSFKNYWTQRPKEMCNKKNNIFLTSKNVFLMWKKVQFKDDYSLSRSLLADRRGLTGAQLFKQLFIYRLKQCSITFQLSCFPVLLWQARVKNNVLFYHFGKNTCWGHCIP